MNIKEIAGDDMSKINSSADALLAHTRIQIEEMLERISELFVPEMKLTFIARHPENIECCMLISDDQIPELRTLLNMPEYHGKGGCIS